MPELVVCVDKVCRFVALDHPAGRENGTAQVVLLDLLDRQPSRETTATVAVAAKNIHANIDVSQTLCIQPAIGQVLERPRVVDKNAVADIEKTLIRPVQLVLPLELACLNDTVVPDHSV